MTALLSNIVLQWKLNLRDKEIITVYYIVPLVFYLFMSGVFKIIMPGINETLIPSMVVFGGTMGAMLGSPAPLINVFATDIKKSYIVGGVPLYSALIVNFLSAFIHMFMMCCIITFSAPFLFGATLPTTVAYWVGLVLFIFASLSIAMILGVTVKDVSKAGMIGQVVFLPTVMLSGIMIPSTMLPEIFTTMSKVLPGSWGFTLMTQTEITLQPILILCVISIVGISISLFKVLKSH